LTKLAACAGALSRANLRASFSARVLVRERGGKRPKQRRPPRHWLAGGKRFLALLLRERVQT
jgi:hypothetical protein